MKDKNQNHAEDPIDPLTPITKVIIEMKQS